MKTFSRWLNKFLGILEFVLFYLWEVVISNLRVARDVLYPSSRMKPGIIKVSIEGLTDRQLLATANLITMTPGTLSLETNIEEGVLIVHSLYVEDESTAARELENLFKERIRRVF